MSIGNLKNNGWARPFRPFPSMSCDSMDRSLLHVGGTHECKEVTCDQTGANTVNLFDIVGCVHVIDITAHCVAVVDSTTFSNVKFSLIDTGTNTDDICTAVDASGILPGGALKKLAATGSALSFSNSDQCRAVDLGLAIAYAPFDIVPYSVDNACKLRLHYTGDGSTDLVLKVDISYYPICAAGAVTPV